jgi:hypothetical protein
MKAHGVLTSVGAAVGVAVGLSVGAAVGACGYTGKKPTQATDDTQAPN